MQVILGGLISLSLLQHVVRLYGMFIKPMEFILQISSDMQQSDNLQKARRPTTPGAP